MDKYSCKRCGEEFSQKYCYNFHIKRQIPCENNVDKTEKFEKKMGELDEKSIAENKEVEKGSKIIKQKLQKPF